MKAPDKRQKRLLAGIAAALVLAAVLLILPRSVPEKGSAGGSAVAVIPEADLADGDGTKTGSYGRGGTISDYWDELGGEDSAPEPAAAGDEAADAVPAAKGSRRPPSMEVDDIFGDYREAAPPKKPAGSSRPATPVPAVPAEDKAPGETADTDPAPVRMTVRRSGSVSSLDDEDGADPAGGFSTLDGTEMRVEDGPGKAYRCMFIRDEKVRSGQRVAVRLLEDIVVDGVRIPRNTHLQGVATISGRMEVEITSLDVGGRILSFRFEAFDTDGGRGIYCSDLGQARKEAAEQGVATLGGLLNSRLGKVARDAASVGASIVRSKAGEATVSVPAGYTFYIIRQTR